MAYNITVLRELWRENSAYRCRETKAMYKWVLQKEVLPSSWSGRMILGFHYFDCLLHLDFPGLLNLCSLHLLFHKQVVIMLVVDKQRDRALLSRQSRFVPRMWSTLAGFIEVLFSNSLLKSGNPHILFFEVLYDLEPASLY